MSDIIYVDAIPKMTSDTTPSGVVTASSYYNDNYKPFYAFDKTYGNDQQTWCSALVNNFPQWLCYQFPQPKCIVRVVTVTRNESNVRGVKTFIFQASNDGETWTDLMTCTNDHGNTGHVKDIFDIPNSNFYTYYRLYITERINSRVQGCGFAEVEMYEMGYYTPGQGGDIEAIRDWFEGRQPTKEDVENSIMLLNPNCKEHLVQVLSEDYVSAQRYDLNKSSIDDTIKSLIDYMIEFDRLSNAVSTTTKAKLIESINDILDYAHNTGGNTREAVHFKLDFSSSTGNITGIIFLYNVDVSDVLMGDVSRDGYYQDFRSISNLAVTNAVGFKFVVSGSTITYSAQSSFSRVDIVGTRVYFNSAVLTGVTNNYGVKYEKRYIDSNRLGSWRLTGHYHERLLDKLFDYKFGNNQYELSINSGGLYINAASIHALLPPNMAFTGTEVLEFKIKIGYTQRTGSDNGRLFSYFAQNSSGSAPNAGFVWHYATAKWGLWDPTNSWRDSDISDPDYFANSELKIVIDKSNNWQVYKDGVAIFANPVPMEIPSNNVYGGWVNKGFYVGSNAKSYYNSWIERIDVNIIGGS